MPYTRSFGTYASKFVDLTIVWSVLFLILIVMLNLLSTFMVFLIAGFSFQGTELVAKMIQKDVTGSDLFFTQRVDKLKFDKSISDHSVIDREGKEEHDAEEDISNCCRFINDCYAAYTHGIFTGW